MVAKTHRMPHGVATISRMLKNIGLFCKRDLQKRPIFCKTTYIFKYPTNCSHPIRPVGCLISCVTVRKVAAANGKALLKNMTCKDGTRKMHTHTHTYATTHTHTHPMGRRHPVSKCQIAHKSVMPIVSACDGVSGSSTCCGV